MDWVGTVFFFFIKSILPDSPGLAATCLLGSEDCQTLGAKLPRGDREERGGGPAVAVEGDYAGKASRAPRQSRAAAVSACFLK